METKTKQYSILVTDDHPLYRQGITRILKYIPTIGKIGEAGNCDELMKSLEQRRWDIVILNTQYPALEGVSTMCRIMELRQPPFVIIMAHQKEMNYVRQMYGLGVQACLLRQTTPEELEQAVLAVISGESYFSNPIKQLLFENIMNHDKLRENELTDRETEVLRLICEEKTSQDIADELHLSEETINKYRKNLLEKTGCRNMAGLVLYAIRHGLFMIS
jgi:DNA-binding NarL/FixJ family response regulator